jgi:chemotaxis signal transduction protein
MKEILESSSAAHLRADFDRSFAEAREATEQGRESLLAIQLGGDPYALRISEIRGLSRDRRIARMPSDAPGFLGLAGLRGVLWPVWDLALLLGYPQAEQAPWIALALAEPIWALAFERFEGYLHLSANEIHPTADQGSFASFSLESALSQGTLRPILDLGLVAKTIQSKNPSMLKGNPR